MMGQHIRSESLFYYFRLEDHVPENHLLRLIERHISLAFVREKLQTLDASGGWCQARGQRPLPAKPETVALYITNLAGTRKPGTLTQRIRLAGTRLQLIRINGVLLEGDPAQLLSCEGPDNYHRPGAARTFPTRWWPSISSRDGWGVLPRGHRQQLPVRRVTSLAPR